jgi:hypothetical protein
MSECGFSRAQLSSLAGASSAHHGRAADREHGPALQFAAQISQHNINAARSTAQSLTMKRALCILRLIFVWMAAQRELQSDRHMLIVARASCQHTGERSTRNNVGKQRTRRYCRVIVESSTSHLGRSSASSPGPGSFCTAGALPVSTDSDAAAEWRPSGGCSCALMVGGYGTHQQHERVVACFQYGLDALIR